MNNYYNGLAFPEYKTRSLAYDPQDTLTKVSFPNYNTNTVDTPVLPQNNPSLFSGLISPTWQGVGSTLQGIGGLANAYMGYKQYGLAKDAFKFNRGLANRNLAIQGQLLNQEMYDRKARALAGSSLSPEEKARALEEVKNKYIDTTPIK
jgi:hypothetical protein